MTSETAWTNVIGEWMAEFFLCLNQTKTKILVVAPPSVREKIIIGGIILDKTCIRFVDSAKNLGVVIDSMLTFKEQIDKLVKACFITIRKLAKVKVYLSQEQLQVLVSSLVFSILDYCKSVYINEIESCKTRSNSSFGDRAFSHVGHKLWNLLPKSEREEDDLVEFKKKLKSFLITRGDDFIEWAKRRWS